MRSLLLLAAAAAAAPAHRRAAAGTANHKRAAVSESVAVDALGSADCTLPTARPPQAQRKFVSGVVDSYIASLLPKFKDPNMATLFANSLPNTLDTTIFAFRPTDNSRNITPDTFVITGDITAMWLRDSTNQVFPYLRWVKQDPALADLIRGVIGRQARSILLDPYANAFQQDATQGQGPHADDSTSTPAFAGTRVDAMTPAIFERKFELDTLMNPLRLSAGYYNATGDNTPFNGEWLAAVQTVLDTVVEQQKDFEEENASGGPVYQWSRTASNPTDTLYGGRGWPGKHNGLVKCGFRGSDDALLLPYNIPENAFAAAVLADTAALLTALGQSAMAAQASALSTGIRQAIQAAGVYTHPVSGQKIYAYEVDGFGNYYFMDDANIPGLLSMPYYGFTTSDDPLYQATRAHVLSSYNPWYMTGSAGSGVGGPHNGWPYVWPMALISQAWTSTNDTEIGGILSTLVQASACTGLVHESFNKDSVFDYTRPWFAWVNALFGDLVLKVADERPYLIFN